MGSCEATCKVCDEIKWIRFQCESCGENICEDCRCDYVDFETSLCVECIESHPITISIEANNS